MLYAGASFMKAIYIPLDNVSHFYEDIKYVI
jgi:hypothetical protein